MTRLSQVSARGVFVVLLNISVFVINFFDQYTIY
jgi:hypothetical protein